jgi:hypothetical protein
MNRIKGDHVILLVAALVLFLFVQSLFGSVGIKPAYVEVQMDKGRPSGKFIISNLGDTEERYRINAVHFVYSESGGLKQSKTGDFSLAPFIRFNPKEITLAPKTEQAIRFAIVTQGKLEQGEHWAAMELESLNVIETVSKDANSGKSVKLKTITSIMVPIFGTVGDVVYSGQVKDVNIVYDNNDVELQVMVAATGTGRLAAAGNYEILDSSGNIIDQGKLGTAYIMRGYQRLYSRKIDVGVPDNQYTVKVSFQAEQLEKPLTKEVRIVWPKLQIQVNDESNAKQEADAQKPQSQPQGSHDGAGNSRA